MRPRSATVSRLPTDSRRLTITRAIAGSAVAGLGGAYDSLSQIGITSSRDGTLTLDSARFQAALAADPDPGVAVCVCFDRAK